MIRKNKAVKIFPNYNADNFKERIDSIIKSTQKQMLDEYLLFEKENIQVFRMVNSKTKKSVDKTA